MKTERTYSSLPVWNHLMDYVKSIYLLTSTFPQDEKEGLGRKLRNKVTDIPVMFASGTNGQLGPESRSHIAQSMQALLETETLLMICMQLSIIQPKELENFQEQILNINKEFQALLGRINRNFK